MVGSAEWMASMMSSRSRPCGACCRCSGVNQVSLMTISTGFAIRMMISGSIRIGDFALLHVAAFHFQTACGAFAPMEAGAGRIRSNEGVMRPVASALRVPHAERAALLLRSVARTRGRADVGHESFAAPAVPHERLADMLDP